MSYKDEMKPVNILFACTQNAVRSVIAEGLLQNRQNPHIAQIASCGVVAGIADGFAMAVMAEAEIDITAHEPVGFELFSAENFQFIISFSHDADQFVQQWAGTDTTRLFWDVHPPIVSESSREETLASYRALRDEIAGRLDRFLQEYSLS